MVVLRLLRWVEERLLERAASQTTIVRPWLEDFTRLHLLCLELLLCEGSVQVMDLLVVRGCRSAAIFRPESIALLSLQGLHEKRVFGGHHGREIATADAHYGGRHGVILHRALRLLHRQ